MSDTVIELTGVRKSFGRKEVLAGVDLHVERGQTYAFLGRNGEGKTTAIRMMMGLLKPNAGTVRILGMDPATQGIEIRRRVGYLAEDQQMWGWMKIRELLRFMAAFYPNWDWTLTKLLLEKFALPTEAKVRHLSKGQNVRLGLLLALAHRPRLVVLDDPALGLDPIMRKEFLRDVVEHLQGGEVTVFFSSHLLYEIEPVADVVGILNGGKMAAQSGTEDLREHVRQFLVDAEDWSEISAKMPGVLDVKRDGGRIAVVVSDAEVARTVLGGMVIAETPLNLDEIFEAYVAGKTAAVGGTGKVAVGV